MAAKKKRIPKAHALPKSITLRAPNPIWGKLQDIRNNRTRDQGKQLSTNSVLLAMIEEEHDRIFS